MASEDFELPEFKYKPFRGFSEDEKDSWGLPPIKDPLFPVPYKKLNDEQDSWNLPALISHEELMKRTGLNIRPKPLEVEVRREPERNIIKLTEYECNILRRKEGDGIVGVTEGRYKVNCEYFEYSEGILLRPNRQRCKLSGESCAFSNTPPFKRN